MADRELRAFEWGLEMMALGVMLAPAGWWFGGL